MSISILLADNLKSVPINQFPNKSWAADHALNAIRDFKSVVDLILAHAADENPDYWDAYIHIERLNDPDVYSTTGYPEFDLDESGAATFTISDAEQIAIIPAIEIKSLRFCYDT